jgi:fibrillarin-like rRNA methylase
MTSRYDRFRRWSAVLRKLAPILLDTAGIILLSSSAMLWLGLAAGAASLGVGCFVLNWRIHGS